MIRYELLQFRFELVMNVVKNIEMPNAIDAITMFGGIIRLP